MSLFKLHEKHTLSIQEFNSNRSRINNLTYKINSKCLFHLLQCLVLHTFHSSSQNCQKFHLLQIALLSRMNFYIRFGIMPSMDPSYASLILLKVCSLLISSSSSFFLSFFFVNIFLIYFCSCRFRSLACQGQVCGPISRHF